MQIRKPIDKPGKSLDIHLSGKIADSLSDCDRFVILRGKTIKHVPFCKRAEKIYRPNKNKIGENQKKGKVIQLDDGWIYKKNGDNIS